MSLGAFTGLYYLLFFLFIGTTATPVTMTTLFLFYNFTQILVAIFVRGKQHFFWQRVKPSRLLLVTIVLFMAVWVELVYISFTASIMGFATLLLVNLAVLAGVTIAYIFLLYMVKVAISKWELKRIRV